MADLLTTEADEPDVCVYCRSGAHDVCSAYRRAPEGHRCSCSEHEADELNMPQIEGE